MRTTKIYGAPGTGKTTWMLNQLEKELKTVPLERIAFVTHTVAAKREAKERAMRKFKYSEAQFKYFKTIHGICYSEVGYSPDNVMQASDYLKFGDSVGIPFSVNFTGEKDIDGTPIGFNLSSGNEILAVRQLAAARQVTVSDIPEEWPEWISPNIMRAIITDYSEYKRKHAKFDFIDMLTMYDSRMGHPLDIDVLFIDEAQDLSPLQWRIIDKMKAQASRVYIAGDDDQSIYGFIGAAPNTFYKHKADKTIILPKSYRLRTDIWNFAQGIIDGVHERKEKKITCRDTGGEIDYWNIDPVYLDVDHEQHTMIIARHHKQLQKIRKDLTARGVPHIHNNKSVAYSPHARAIKAYLKCVKVGRGVQYKEAAYIATLMGKDELSKNLKAVGRNNPEKLLWLDDLSEHGLLPESDWRGVYARTPAEVEKNMMLDNIIHHKGLDALGEKPKVHLTTYHGSKGREADHVILFTDCYDKAWAHSEKYPDDERRLSYVGATRAREQLTIVLPQTDQYMRSLS